MTKNLVSTNGYRCLSRCEKADTNYFHPILFSYINEQDFASCAIYPKFQKTERGPKIQYLDQCEVENNERFVIPDQFQSVISGFQFYPREFLESIYNVHNFDDVIAWTLDNLDLPETTLARVHNCAWRVFARDDMTQLVLQYYYARLMEYHVLLFANQIRKQYEVENIPLTVADNQDALVEWLRKQITYEYFMQTTLDWIESFDDKRWSNMQYPYWDYIDHWINVVLNMVKSQ